jgi:hypothetical protein
LIGFEVFFDRDYHTFHVQFSKQDIVKGKVFAIISKGKSRELRGIVEQLRAVESTSQTIGAFRTEVDSDTRERGYISTQVSSQQLSTFFSKSI